MTVRTKWKQAKFMTVIISGEEEQENLEVVDWNKGLQLYNFLLLLFKKL